MNKVTTQTKNIAIKQMIEDSVNMKNIIKENGHHYPSYEELKFHSDANWQFEALKFIEDLGYDTSISSYLFENRVLISTGNPQGDGGRYTEYQVDIESKTKKEAIFEALYQFSQYLKEKK